jgi:hypothetical protein
VLGLEPLDDGAGGQGATAVLPTGWPRAMAPPFTLTLSMSGSMTLAQLRATDAKASLTSKMSMSLAVMPAFSSTLAVASGGPSSR